MFRVSIVKNPDRAAAYHSVSPENSNALQEEESRCNWIGQAAEALQLRGPCPASGIQSLAEGRHPADGLYLPGLVVRENRSACFDMLFAAPKAVSVAALVGGDMKVADCHVRAAETAFREAEVWAATRHAPARGPATIMRTGNLVAAHAIHTHSRRGDPHLHSHFLSFNVTWSPHHRRWMAVTPKSIIDRAALIRAIYHHELACNVREAGYKALLVGQSMTLAGIPKAVESIFSKGHNEIDALSSNIYGDDEDFRARRWANERSRSRSKLFTEGYHSDQERWLAELDSEEGDSIRIVVANAIESRQDLTPKKPDQAAEELRSNLPKVLTALFQETLIYSPYKLAQKALQHFFGEYHWSDMRRAISQLLTISRASKEVRARAARRSIVAKLSVLPPSARPAIRSDLSDRPRISPPHRRLGALIPSPVSIPIDRTIPKIEHRETLPLTERAYPHTVLSCYHATIRQPKPTVVNGVKRLSASK